MACRRCVLRLESIFFNCSKVVLLLYHFLSLFSWLFLSKLSVLLLFFFWNLFLVWYSNRDTSLQVLIAVRNVRKAPYYPLARSLTESCKKFLMQLENIKLWMFFRMYYNYLLLFHWFQTITRNWRQKNVTFSFWFHNTIILNGI